MSADRWGICPKCKFRAEQAQAQKILAAGESYGKVDPQDYLDAINEASKPIELSNTLREDYEISTDEDGHFEVSYRSSCRQCDHSFTYTHSERAWSEPKPHP